MLSEWVSTEDLPAAVESLEEHIDALATRRAGELFRRVLLSLPVTAETTALQRAILGGQEESLRTAATRCNVSWMTLWRYERAVRGALSVTAVRKVE